MNIAFRLYMSGTPQKEIAESLEVSPATISGWCAKGNWEVKRASHTTSSTELVKKLLTSVNTMLDLVESSGDLGLMMKLPEKLSGFANMIDKLNNRDSILELIEAFEGFNAWLELESIKDKRLTRELLAIINELQEKYVDSKIQK